jgi:hypothetical protein
VADAVNSRTRSPRLTRAIVRYRLTPWWVKVIAIFVASRVLTTSIMMYFAAQEQPNNWTGANPNYLDFANIWDGHWYYIVAVSGYPSTLPLTSDGHVGESAWAFMPGYPSFIRLLSQLTGLDFALLSVIASVGFSLGAALVLYRIFFRLLPHGSLFAIVVFCCAPLSPIYQVAYAEAMHLFLVVVALHLLIERRYWVLIPVIAVMALTRPSGLAFALALGLHFLWRFSRRFTEDFPDREQRAAIIVTLFSAFAGIAWVLVAWLVTGVPNAYTQTELAWRSGYIGYQDLVPFTSWAWGAGFWLQYPEGPWIVAGAATFLIVFFGLLFTRAGKRLGVDLRFWLFSYMLYLLAVFFPQSSTFRLLVPLAPALGILAQPRSRVYRVLLVAASIAGQIWWVRNAWFISDQDWTPP